MLLESWNLELVAPMGHWNLMRGLWLHHLHHFEQWVRLGGNWLLVHWLWLEHSEWVHCLGSVLLMMRLVLVVVNLWLHKLHHVLLRFNSLLNELLNGLVDALEDLIDIWEHQLKWVDILVLVVLVGIFNLSVESLFLDVRSLDGLVPLVVESTDRGSQLSHIVCPSVELSHLFEVRVASVINVGKLVQIEHHSKDVENVVKDSFLHVLLEDALPWVLKAPSLEVILNSLEMADLEILIKGVDNKATSILDFIDTNGPEVFVNLLVESMETGEGWLDPVTKALLRDDMIVLGVPSFDVASVNVLQE